MERDHSQSGLKQAPYQQVKGGLQVTQYHACVHVRVCVRTFVSLCVCMHVCTYRHSLSARDTIGNQASMHGASTNFTHSLTQSNKLQSFIVVESAFTLHGFPVDTIPFLCCSSHTHHTHTHTHTHITHTVTNLRVITTTTNSATITWDQPPHNYRVFLHGEATDNIPQSRVIQLVDVTGQTTHIVEGLNPFRKYSISVYLESTVGQGSSVTVTFQTLGTGESAEGTMSLSACVHMCMLGGYIQM